MDKAVLYRLWLTEDCKLPITDINALSEHFDSVEEIFLEKDFSSVSKVSPHTRRTLCDKSTKKAEKIIRSCEDNGFKILSLDSPSYPDSLRTIAAPPQVLYLRGEEMKWDRLLPIGVVGTRSCTKYGCDATVKIVYELAASGVTVVSGMASGIDTVAARAALDAGNKTVAVLGCGIDRAYPFENSTLMEEIIENGAVISEYPPGAGADRWHFPQRNRIISGLSRGVLVTEAPMGSGALITANCALEQGKDVFAVPGSIFVRHSEGSNRLLASGAKAVLSAKDILEEYTFEIERLNIKKPSAILKAFGGKKSEKVNNEIKISADDKRFSALSEKEKAIISLLIDGNLHIDDIARKSGLTASELTPTLSILEFGGHIQKIPGNNYKLNIQKGL